MSAADLDPDALLAFAGELADLARPIALSYFRTPLDVAAQIVHHGRCCPGAGLQPCR